MRKFKIGDRVRLTAEGKAYLWGAPCADAEGVISTTEPEDYAGVFVYLLKLPNGLVYWAKETHIEALENFKIGATATTTEPPKGWHFLALPEEVDMPRVFREAYEAGLEAFCVNPPGFPAIAYVRADSPLMPHVRFHHSSRSDWDLDQRYLCVGHKRDVQQAREALAEAQAREQEAKAQAREQEAKAARKRVLRERGVRIEVKPL